SSSFSALAGDHPQRAVEGAEHAVKLLPAAQDVTGRGDHAVRALTAGDARAFLDAVDREFDGAAENGKHGPVFEEIDCVVAPFAGGDLAAVEAEIAVKLTTAESDFACGGGHTNLAPAQRARFSIAEFHTAPPVSLKLRYGVMIAPDGRDGKSLAR